jgi:hypothetical protein
VLELAIAFAVSGFALDKMPQADFDHQAACHHLRTAAAADHAQPGRVINNTTKHGGVSVDCETRSVEIRTLISRNMRRSWLKAQERNWRDDVCSDPVFNTAVGNGWKITQIIVVRGKVAAVFKADCGHGS